MELTSVSVVENTQAARLRSAISRIAKLGALIVVMSQTAIGTRIGESELSVANKVLSPFYDPSKRLDPRGGREFWRAIEARWQAPSA